MGRFSKLETGRGDDPRADLSDGAPRPADSPIGPTDEPVYDADGYMARGDEAFYTGDSKQALRIYSRAMQLDKSCVRAWIAAIQVQVLMGQLKEAEVWINRALSVFPNAPGLLGLRAVNHARRGMIRQALSTSDMILTKRGEDATAWTSRGHVLLIAGNRNSDFCFDQALQFSSDGEWQVPFLIGMIHENERQWSKAIPRFEKALERRSSLPYAWMRIAHCHATLGHPEAARRALAQAETLCGDNELLAHKVRNASTGTIFARVTNFFKRR